MGSNKVGTKTRWKYFRQKYAAPKETAMVMIIHTDSVYTSAGTPTLGM